MKSERNSKKPTKKESTKDLRKENYDQESPQSDKKDLEVTKKTTQEQQAQKNQ